MRRTDVGCTVPKDFPHEDEAGQGPEAKSPYPSVDSSTNKQHHPVCTRRHHNHDLLPAINMKMKKEDGGKIIEISKQKPPSRGS